MARPKKDNEVQYWLDEIDACRKREKDYRKDGQEICDIYAGDKKDETPFNILFSNTETLLPALFSQTPRPIVEQKHKNKKDIVGQMAANASQKLLEYLVDNNLEGYETYSGSMEAATLDALLPGRAVTAIKYDAPDDLSWELVCTDHKKWDRVYFGYATKWEEVPWMAYELYVDKKEAENLIGKLANKLKYTENEDSDDDDKVDEDEDDQGGRETTCLYQIWDKDTKTVKYVSTQYKEGFLKEIKDPLSLSGFFNCPKPLKFINKPGSLTPKAPYKLYENQALELNRLTRRLNKIIEAIKVRGVYDAALGDDLKKLFDQDDNGLEPTEKGASLLDGGFDKAIWMMPVEKLVGTATALYQARESCKSVIYEIMGIGDIIRGASKASETLGAQNIKDKWGSMRLKRSQKDVAEYSRSTLRLMLEVAIQNFSVKSWVKMTGLEYPTDEQKQKAQEMIKNFQKQSQAMQQKAQQTGQPPQPPPPQMQQQLAEYQKIAGMPSWEDILKALKDDYQRSYRIDIETNSTLDVEATEDKKLIAEFMNAMGQLMNGVMPMVKEKIMPFNAMKSMFSEIAQRFRFGRNVQEEIDAMQEPKGPNPEEMQKKMEESQKQIQQAQQKIQSEQQQVEQAKESLLAQSKQMNDKLTQQAAKLQQQETDLRFREMELKHQKEMMMMKQPDTALQETQMEIAMKKAIAIMQAQIKAETAIETAHIKAESTLQVAQISAETTLQATNMNNETSFEQSTMGMLHEQDMADKESAKEDKSETE